MDRLVEPKGSNGSKWSFLTKSSKEEIRLRFALTIFFFVYFTPPIVKSEANRWVMPAKPETVEEGGSA